MASSLWQRSDGELLKALREQAGLDPVVLARMGTMTVQQLRGLEEGEGGEFYSPEIKAHMGRSLLAKLGYVTPPAGPTPPANARDAGPAFMAPATAAPPAPTREPSAVLPVAASRPRGSRRVHAAAASALAAVVLGAYALWAPAGSQRLDPAAAQAAAVQPPAAVAAVQPPAAAAADTSPAPAATESGAIAPATQDGCTADDAAPSLAYTPAEPRKAGNFVHLVADKPARLCVLDAARKATRVDLEPGASRSIHGAPPFVVRGDLGHLRIFFQGVRVQGELATGTQVVLNEAPLR